jgi:hypothetical protein
MPQRRAALRWLWLGLLLLAQPVFANFASNEIILPAAGRVIGAGGFEFITTVWLSNPTDHPITVQLQYLLAGQANPDPATVEQTLAPRESKTYEDIAGTLFGIVGRLGAIRVRGSEEILVSARIHHGTPLSNSQGVFLAGVPSKFAIGTNETSQLLGVTENDDFHYNIFLVEVAGEITTVELEARDGSGAVVAVKQYTLLAYEQILVALRDVIGNAVMNGGTLRATEPKPTQSRASLWHRGVS